VDPPVAAASEKVLDSVAATHEQAAIEVLQAWAGQVAVLAEPAEVAAALVVEVEEEVVVAAAGGRKFSAMRSRANKAEIHQRLLIRRNRDPQHRLAMNVL